MPDLAARLRGFVRRPWSEKRAALRLLAGRLGAGAGRLLMPRPVRLPWGHWMLTWADVMGDNLRRGGYELPERLFIERFVRPGMTFLDVGAHNGYYSLLASRRVGPAGRVVAFEPSPRERRRLRWNLALNRCRNVAVEPCALGAGGGSASLFVVRGRETGFNSLRPPALDQPTRQVRVAVDSLDRCAERLGLSAVHFVKLDVEGAELDALRGAEGTLRRFSPAVMCELTDARTEPWGYRGVDIHDFLAGLGYRWFALLPDGRPSPCPRKERFHENLLALAGAAAEAAPDVPGRTEPSAC